MLLGGSIVGVQRWFLPYPPLTKNGYGSLGFVRGFPS
jgi:hypothetical protein